MTRRDLLLLLPVETSERVDDLHIDVHGENGLVAAVDPRARAEVGAHLEPRNYAGDAVVPTAPDGHRVTTGWVARVPVTLDPTAPWDVGGDRYPLSVTASYRVDDAGAPRTFSARAAVDAEVGPAIYQMGAASLLLPFVCIGAAVVRWRQTR